MKQIVLTIFSLFLGMLLMTSLVSAEVDFNEDDIGKYAFFWYTLPQNIQTWLNNQPSVIDLVVSIEGYTQVWVDLANNGYKALKQKIINFDEVRNINKVLTADLPNGYDCGLNLKDRLTGEIYNIYISNGSIKLDQDLRCLS